MLRMFDAPSDSRPVGVLQLLALGINGIVGVGIFFVPAAVAASAPGLGAVAVFALTGLALLPAALSFATLGRRFDEDGGPVVFARAAFGERVSFVVGWVAYVSALFSTSAVVVGLTRAVLPGLGFDDAARWRGWRRRCSPRCSPAVVASGLRISARVWTGLTRAEAAAAACCWWPSSLPWAAGSRRRRRPCRMPRGCAPRSAWSSPARASRSCR